MLKLWVLASLLVLLSSCIPARPSTAEYPTPVASAAHPGVAGRGAVAYARKGAEAIRTALREWEPEEAVATIPGEGLALLDGTVQAGCAGADGALPVLVCHFGPDRSRPVAQAIFWYDRGLWEAQVYPAAPEPLTRERLKAFSPFACGLGCSGGIRRVRPVRGPEGTSELLVVVDLGFTGKAPAEEVQLLRLVDGLWEVQWVPGAGDWNYGHARVTLPPQGAAQFEVTSTSWLRQDGLSGYLSEEESGEHRRFRDRWVRKGPGFLLRDRVEAPTPYSALLRVIHHLSTGGDEKAMSLIDPAIPLEKARAALAQRPRHQGWTVARWGESGFRLGKQGTGGPDLRVRFERRGERWVLVEIHPDGD